jgi:carboxyl-terminal processing protease
MDNGQLKVISPLVGTPAYRAGLEAGDIILKIEGEDTAGLHIDEAVKRLKGEAGTSVTLTIRHLGVAEPETLTITREWVHVETVLGDKRKPDDSWDFMLDHDKHIGYVRISGFSRDTAEDLKKALVDLQGQGLKGLVVDLRFNPGGLLTSAIDVSDLFVSEGKIVSTSGRNVPERSWDAQKDGTFDGFPMAVLVNHYSASASEILSACLQDHKRAVIIGERTWGKGSVQNVIELEGGKSALKLTTASYQRPSGKNIHKFPDAKDTDEWGVLPDPGFDVKLSMNDTRRLIEYRHDRDILLGKHGRPTDEDKAEAAKDEKPMASESKPEDAKPAAEKPSEEKPAADKPDADKPDDAKPADHPPTDAKPEAAEKEDDSKPFVDVQLQKAIDYLTEELARAQ